MSQTAEALLYGTVPAARHDQVVKILAGITRQQPRRILQRCIVYKPLREPEEPGSNLRRGGTQNIINKPADKKKEEKFTAQAALYYTKLVQRLSEGDFGAQQQASLLSAHAPDDHGAKWSMLWEDAPDTGDRGVSVRFSNTTDILSGDPHAQMIAAGPNRFVTEYYVEGHRFVQGNVVVFLHRVLHEPGIRNLQHAPKTKLPSFASLQLLDPSGAFILEAKVRVQDLKETGVQKTVAKELKEARELDKAKELKDAIELQEATVLETAVKELKAFQTLMKGCVELELPDRLALDTRVKYKPT